MLSLGDEEAGRLLASVPEDARDECWWLVRRDGKQVRGDDGGGVELLVEVRITRRLGRVLQTLGASRIVDAFDRLVSRHRSRLGRFLPDGPAPRRYP